MSIDANREFLRRMLPVSEWGSTVFHISGVDRIGVESAASHIGEGKIIVSMTGFPNGSMHLFTETLTHFTKD